MSSAALPHYHFLDRLKALPFVETIYLFGSRARGDNRERSDIDLAIACPAATSEQWRTIKEIIDEADTFLEIDCVRLEEADKEFAEEIRREGIKL